MLGDIIKLERNKLGLSQSEFSKKMGVTQQTLSNWENGNRMPDIETIIELADLFGVSIDYLTGRTKMENRVDKQNDLLDDISNFSLENQTKLKRIYRTTKTEGNF